MAISSTGSLSLLKIQSEFGGVNPISLSEYYRGGAYVTTNNTNVPTSGVTKISNFYGAVKQFAFTISSNFTTTQNLRTLAISAGWNQSDALLATVATGVTLYGNAGVSGGMYYGGNQIAGGAGSTALTVSGAYPNGVILVNNGTIAGGGGAGGGGGSTYSGGNGGAGGTGLSISSAISIYNYGTIAGGGGGGSGAGAWGTGGIVRSGGGGGGGAGFGQFGYGGDWEGIDGGAGGTGTATAGGGGGYSDQGLNVGGAGGTLGAVGISGINSGAPGSNPPGTPGAAGFYVVGNSNITWLATGTRLGSVS